jgi:hypothetical protein
VSKRSAEVGPDERRPYKKLSQDAWKRVVDQVDRQIESGTLKPESAGSQAQLQQHEADSQARDPSASIAVGNNRSFSLGRAKLLRGWHWVVVAVLAFLFGVFVWPTPYEYHPSNENFGAVLRISRFSGSVDYMTPNGWVPIRRK